MTSAPIQHIPGPKELARFIDYMLLRPDATREELARVCAEARDHGIGCVCVNGSRAAQAYHFVEDSGVKIIAAVGFPLGAMDADAKRHETEAAVDNDAHFIEVVANIGRIKDGDYGYVIRELRDVVEAADERPVSVVIETPLLSSQEIQTACKIILDAGAKAVVTSTSFAGSNARLEDVRQIRSIVDPQFGIKAAGGVTDCSTALALLEAGATRIGATDAIAILNSCKAA